MRELQPKVAIYKTTGINCDAETAFAFNQAGGKAIPEEAMGVCIA